MRLVRTIILLGGAGLLLPSPPADPLAETGETAAISVSAFEMLSQATSAFSDVAGFCGRQPGVCETAAVVATHLEAKAKYNARLVYEWAAADESLPRGHAVIPVAAPDADSLHTGSAGPARQIPDALRQSSLRLDDLVPPWRKPAAWLKKG